MNPKLPYYMAYPMPLAFDDEWLERRDYEYMKSMYPDAAKKILPYVEEECDRSEHPCSMMYDEYPDRLQLRMMTNRIYQNVSAQEREMPRRGDGRDPLRDLIEILLFEELQRRRNERRRSRRRRIY